MWKDLYTLWAESINGGGQDERMKLFSDDDSWEKITDFRLIYWEFWHQKSRSGPLHICKMCIPKNGTARFVVNQTPAHESVGKSDE